MPTTAPVSGTPNRHMTVEALALLNALDAPRRRQALYSFVSGERFDWHYVPRGRPGLHPRDMDAAQAPQDILTGAGMRAPPAPAPGPAGWRRGQPSEKRLRVLRGEKPRTAFILSGAKDLIPARWCPF